MAPYSNKGLFIMKYQIHINQLVLSETDLDVVEASILDYLVFFCNSKSSRIANQRDGEWTWISYAELIRQMPLIKIKSKSAITTRIQKIEKSGFIDTKRSGRKLFVKLNSLVDQLFVNTNGHAQPFAKTNDTVRENERSTPSTVRLNEPIKTTIINKDYYDKDLTPKVPFEEFYGKYPRKVAKQTALSSWEKLTPEEQTNAVEDIRIRGNPETGDATWFENGETRKQYIPHPATYLNQKRWEDEWEAVEEEITKTTIEI